MSLGSDLYSDLGYACRKVIEDEIKTRGHFNYNEFKKLSKYSQREIMNKILWEFIDRFLKDF